MGRETIVISQSVVSLRPAKPRQVALRKTFRPGLPAHQQFGSARFRVSVREPRPCLFGLMRTRQPCRHLARWHLARWLVTFPPKLNLGANYSVRCFFKRDKNVRTKFPPSRRAIGENHATTSVAIRRKPTDAKA